MIRPNQHSHHMEALAESGLRDTNSGKLMYFLRQLKQRIITTISPSFAGFLNADLQLPLMAHPIEEARLFDTIGIRQTTT